MRTTAAIPNDDSLENIISSAIIKLLARPVVHLAIYLSIGMDAELLTNEHQQQQHYIVYTVYWYWQMQCDMRHSNQSIELSPAVSSDNAAMNAQNQIYNTSA